MTDQVMPAKVYFYTNIFRDAFEGSDETSDQLRIIFDAARQNPKRSVTSELTLAELFGNEASEMGWTGQKRFYIGLIVSSRFIDLRPISREILLTTGDYRRALRQTNQKVKLPDAIHVVTAIKSECQYVFTADRRFPVPSPLQRIAPDKTGMALIEAALRA